MRVAEGIVVEYVPEYAMSRIDFSAGLRAKMLHALNDGKTDEYPHLLKRLREEVYASLERLYLRPFTRSEPFLLMLQALSSGNDLSELQHELYKFDA